MGMNSLAREKCGFDMAHQVRVYRRKEKVDVRDDPMLGQQ